MLSVPCLSKGKDTSIKHLTGMCERDVIWGCGKRVGVRIVDGEGESEAGLGRDSRQTESGIVPNFLKGVFD